MWGHCCLPGKHSCIHPHPSGQATSEETPHLANPYKGVHQQEIRLTPQSEDEENKDGWTVGYRYSAAQEWMNAWMHAWVGS